MPTYNATLLSIDEKETRRYAGLAGHGSFPADLLEKACMDAQLLAKPRGIWQIYPYDSELGQILSTPPLPLQGQKILHHLADSVQVAILAVTIGEAIEQRITRLFADGEYSAGFLLDAAGTTAVEMAADQVTQVIVRNAVRLGYTTTWRFSPGYGDWDITVQPYMLALAQAQHIGLKATESCMLIPRKSITAILGFIPNHEHLELTSNAPELSCNHCTQPTCIARKDGSHK